jgi:energy-coupling factor transporter ATP-binding protein EcfA2
MLGLRLREEFREARLRGTTVEFTNEAKTGALDQSAKDFLRITYPSTDLIKTLEAATLSSNRTVVLVGDRGQGKSHLVAALYHLLSDPSAGQIWLREWADRLGRPELGNLTQGPARHVIAEPLHERRYTHLWDLLFARHPNGEHTRHLWSAQKIEVPGKDLLVGMLSQAPCALLLDEFQTWFDGLSNSVEPRQTWAFNFIQILAEIAQNSPRLLTLVVTVREGTSNAAQQLFRVNPLRVDFKAIRARRDRQPLLLHRIFENRGDLADAQIAPLLRVHLAELMRLRQIRGSDAESYERRFIDAWPYSPELLQLLDDEVIPATAAQSTRDLVRILVQIFAAVGEMTPLITPADFGRIFMDGPEQLKDQVLRNIAAVEDALGGDSARVPHLHEIFASIWLRSLSLSPQRVGADPETVQLDVTRTAKIDDHAFQSELATIEANSCNLHRTGPRLVLKVEENPRTRLLAHARNDRLFQNCEDVDFLATQIRQMLEADARGRSLCRTIVLGRGWLEGPLDDFAADDRKIPIIVLPDYPQNLDATLGGWLKRNFHSNRNTVRFLLPRKVAGSPSNLYLDSELLLIARAATLASTWSRADRVYDTLANEFTAALRAQLADRFDRFAILSVWNYADPAKCRFSLELHGARGDTLLCAIQDKIKQDLFADEEFAERVNALRQKGWAADKILAELREPRNGGRHCIPWLGEAEARTRLEKVTDVSPDDCASHSTPPPQSQQRTVTRLASEATSGLNLLSRVVDVWDVKSTTTLRNAAVRIDRLTGAQLKQLIQDLPDGPSYALEADREDP